ncbi:MAG: membrane protein [Anaerolineae bacterium]|nr:MAG: membrane protein [Anaerolineae bacterium]
MQTATARTRWFWPLAALIVLAGAALRFYDLGGPSLWVDEVYTLILAHASLDDTLAIVRDLGNQAPLYYVLLHAYPTGSDFALRSFSALLGVLGIGGMIWAVRRLYRSPWLALGAGALLAFNPYHIWLSRTARVYALAFVLALLASYAFLKLLSGARTRTHWALFVLATMAGTISHYFAAGLSFAQYVVFGFLLRRKRALFRRWIVAQVVAAIPLLAWIVYMLQAETVSVGLGWILKPQPQDLLLTLSAMTVGTGKTLPVLTLPAVLVALIGLGAGMLYAARHYRVEPDQWYWFWLVVGTLALVFAVSWLVHPLYVDRYFVVILPALIALMLRGWLWLAGPRRPYLAAGAVTLVCLTGLAITLDVFQKGDHYKEDWRGVARYVAAHFQPGDGVLAANPVEMLAFRRYAPIDDFAYAWLLEEEDDLSFGSPVERVWVVARTTADETGHGNEIALTRATDGPVAWKYVPGWVRARQDRVLDQKLFNGLALFLVDTRSEAEQLASAE